MSICNLLDRLGVGRNKEIEEAAYAIAVCLIAILLGWIVRHVTLFIVGKTVAIRHSAIGAELKRRHTLTHCSHIIPPVIILCLIPFAFNDGSHTLNMIMKLTATYTLVAFAIATNSVFTFIWAHYDMHENTKRLPLRGVLNIAKGIVWGVAVIIAVSILVDRSPTALLTGLGAFAAALLLIFRNSILGFVAGIQLALNDMLRVGDWIIVPSTIANGIVTDVTLSVVKIRNWDNTTVTLPPYTLVSTSFQNWRGMKETGFRHIQQSILIDASSVTVADNALADRLSEQFPILKEYIKASRQAGFSDGSLPAGTLSTNLGIYRAYITLYLRENSRIAADQRIMVRLMPQQPDGIPLQIFCYVNATVWSEFSAIQSCLFEHFTAIAPQFGISVYNYPKALTKETGLPQSQATPSN